MLFSSITFLFYFLPCVLFLYFFFYAWGEPYYVIFMAASILIGYITGIQLDKNIDPLRRKMWLFSVVALHAVVLFYFKFSDSLPIGISFYTFQIISYLIDVYRKDVKVQKSLLNLATYISMFPQLIAGPIVRYIDIEKELTERVHGMEDRSDGIRRFILGLSKKVLLANQLGELCDIFVSSMDKSVIYYWMYAIAFTLHIYYDFSGYSDMAIGLGKIFGFHFMENFRYPYVSKSITEFWRRWHISLGSWFRDYVYIPLGGNRVSRGRHIFNILVVWGLTGIWHGGALTFLVWGLYFALLLLLEKFWLLKKLEKTPIVARIYTLLFVIIGFVIFNASSMSEAISYIGCMFGAGAIPVVSAEALYYLRSYALLFVVGMIGATPIVKETCGKLKKVQIAEPAVLCVLLLTVIAFLVDGSFNPFLYFRF